MPFPLIIIGIIVLAVIVLLLLPFLIALLKIALIIGALIAIWYFLPKKVITKMANWQFVVLGVAIFLGIMTLGITSGFLSISQLPMTVQQPASQMVFSPINLILGFIIFVLVLMYIKK